MMDDQMNATPAPTPDELFGIPAGVMDKNTPIVDLPIPTETPVVEMPPDEDAAMRFTKMLPFVKKLADAAPSKGSLVRVLHAFAEFPLGPAKPKFLNDAERQLFHIMMELQGYKSTVVTSIMKKQMDLEKEKQNATASTPVAESEGTSNE